MAHEQQSESPASTQKYLKGVDYPAKKSDLREAAEKSGAPEDVLHLIDSLPGDNYDAPTAVMRAFGEVR